MTGTGVLIVEDNETLASIFTNWLRDDYSVHSATTGNAALDLLTDDIDVVLLDRRMPGMSGDSLLAEIRSRDLDCTVAMVTAIEPNVDVVDLGFDDYLTKPVSKEELLETVDTLAKRVQMDDSLQEYLAVASTHSVLENEIGPAGGVNQRSNHSFPEDGVDMSSVTSHHLPRIVTDLADDYEDRIGHRDRFLLQWLHIVFPFFTLSSVDAEFRERARADKTLASFFVMLLDDIGEHNQDQVTLEEVSKLPFDSGVIDRSTPGIDLDYLDVTESVWETLDARLRDAPRYEEIEDILRFDIRQVIHAIRHSVLVNDHPEITNTSEAHALGAHNMMMLTYADIDIAYSSSFRLEEFGALRSFILEIQRMARIGNWITTWERELTEGDVSAGVYSTALEKDVVSLEELRRIEDDPAVRAHVKRKINEAHVEEALLEEWHERYDRLRDDPPAIESVDTMELLSGMERVMAYHLASRGLK